MNNTLKFSKIGTGVKNAIIAKTPMNLSLVEIKHTEEGATNHTLCNLKGISYKTALEIMGTVEAIGEGASQVTTLTKAMGSVTFENDGIIGTLEVS